MTKVSVSRVVPYTADQVYHIAADVSNYRKFLPLVRASTVSNRQKHPNGLETFDAAMTVTYKKLKIDETFVSRVEADPMQKTVKSTSDRPPVKHLTSIWTMKDLPGGKCRIDYFLDYQLKSRALQFFMSGIFDLAMRKIFSAFEARAKELYGSGNA
jgi:coenzyme Q-binding protein COQ10